ncbi:MAG: hypothetical protein LC104_18580 [Bacteroidales bacterium]|nr:hypothetical protein [Bacteroidales bacterium]
MNHEYLFPVRRTRRDFLAASAGVALGLTGVTHQAASAAAVDGKPVTLGTGKAAFRLDPNWGKLPAGMSYGLGCAIVVDSQDRVFVTSRSSSPCVAIFDTQGKLLETWTQEFATGVGYSPDQVKSTAHGLYWSKEPGGEFLYWTENVAGPKDGPKIGARVYKTDLRGKVLHTIGNNVPEGTHVQQLPMTNPTDVAVAPNGDIYIVDGYGSQKVHRLDKNFKHLKTIGGRGKEHGQFNTCHGIWVSTLRQEPEVYIADRANDRIEVFSPELEYKRTISGVLAPCCFYQHGGLMYVPELKSRVTILDADDKIVTHLGDGNGIKENQTRPELFALPHALTLSSRGELFVIEWVPFGRPRKFSPVAG